MKDRSFTRADSPRTSTLLLKSHRLPAATHGWNSTGWMTMVTERVAQESPVRHFHKGETLHCRPPLPGAAWISTKASEQVCPEL